MRIGIYQDMRNPPRWRRPWDEHYATGLARIERAEELGIGSVWFSEHHHFEDGYLPQPHVYAAAAAARTSRIRLGTAIALAPLRKAIEYAEQAAVLDIISGGRFELGLGVGYRVPEFRSYGADISKRFELFEEVLADVRRLIDEEGITPLPLQDPFPIWAGVTGPRGARIAGRHNAGLLWLDETLMAPYREGLEQGGHDPDSARCAGLVQMVVAKDPEKAWATIKEHFAYQLGTYQAYGLEGKDDQKIGVKLLQDVGEIDVDALRSPGPAMILPAFDVVDADEAIRRLTEWLSPLPVVDAFFWDSIAGMPDELADDHIELLATKVQPALADVGVAVPA